MKLSSGADDYFAFVFSPSFPNSIYSCSSVNPKNANMNNNKELHTFTSYKKHTKDSLVFSSSSSIFSNTITTFRSSKSSARHLFSRDGSQGWNKNNADNEGDNEKDLVSSDLCHKNIYNTNKQDKDHKQQERNEGLSSVFSTSNDNIGAKSMPTEEGGKEGDRELPITIMLSEKKDEHYDGNNNGDDLVFAMTETAAVTTNPTPSGNTLRKLRYIGSFFANFLSLFYNPSLQLGNVKKTGGGGEEPNYVSSSLNDSWNFDPFARNRNNSNSSISSTSIHDEIDDTTIEWDIFVDQSKSSKERGAVATLNSFLALSPPNLVQVHPAIITKSKGKGPIIRCMQRKKQSTTTNVTPVTTSYFTTNNTITDQSSTITASSKATIPPPSRTEPSSLAFEVNNVNDVDKVYHILTKYMNQTSISLTSRECLKWTYRGNAYLEKGDVSSAISSYNKALNINAIKGDIDKASIREEGMLLLLRSKAYLKRAFNHQMQLRLTVTDLSDIVPDPKSLREVIQIAIENPTLANAIQDRIVSDSKLMDTKFRLTKYQHGLYEYALLHAAKDSLRATQLLPIYAGAYLSAGDCLAELRKFQESISYYERAIELDEDLSTKLKPIINGLESSKKFMDRARDMGWSGDTLRLALDVSGG